MTLTGRTRYRSGWFGRLILQVEFQYRCIPAGARCSLSNWVTRNEWRDATTSDALAGNIRIAPTSQEDAA
jgi:hypothetical protein